MQQKSGTNFNRTLALAIVMLALAACHGSGAAALPASPTYTVGGTISGVPAGLTIALLNNGNDNLADLGDGRFMFKATLPTGVTYAVTVTDSTGVHCRVADGTGRVAGNISNVIVTCERAQWTWMGGSNDTGAKGVYGMRGLAAPSNTPGARDDSTSWTDNHGNLWLFGGSGVNSTGDGNYLNDLWMYNPVTQQWTWESGSTGWNQKSIYGNRGTAAASNTPGARSSSAAWIDKQGNLWLFGGEAIKPDGIVGNTNDLWMYSPDSKQWTWEGGTTTWNQRGAYGAPGVTAAGNMPGSREASANWTDKHGNLWLFGGLGYAATGISGNLNDLWMYNPHTKQWTWEGGSNLAEQAGVYGTRGQAAADNVPGARFGSASWTDKHGNLWLFGGTGDDSAGNSGGLNDLWMYNPVTKQWAWEGGSSVIADTNDLNATPGIYGTRGRAAAENMPGSREASVSWTDARGNLWLFGGEGAASAGRDDASAYGDLNDLWMYNPTTKQWTWQSGFKAAGLEGTYGTRGVSAAENVPGSRGGSVSWLDANGNLWLFGGNQTGDERNDMNDLWVYH